MPALTDSVVAVVESVFVELLDLPARPDAVLPVAPGPLLRASVRVSGAWEGVVVLDCPEELARRTATAMLGSQPHDRAQLADAIGELTNVIAGNLKVLLPAPSRLSLPAVTDTPAAGPARSDGVVARATVACDGQPLTIWVRELDADSS